jgi:hypothetical protein
MADTKLNSHFTAGARVEKTLRGSAYRLTIPSGKANEYRLAQLDDYTRSPRGRFPHRSGSTLSLSARTSSDSIPGTWGFGLWNDPFGLSLGFGGNPFRLPALPNAVWFFGASKENYLSFKEPAGFDTGGENTRPTQPARRETANGFLAQTFRSPRFHPLLIPAGLALPFSRKTTRRLLSRVIEEDGIVLHSRHSPTPMDAQESASYAETISVDPTQWHRYRLEWRKNRVSFEVDEALVFESPVSPIPPLGLVIWIDNQYAAFTPEGKIGFGVLENPEPASLEIRELEIG